MPYVKQEVRLELEKRGPNTPGELNYLITKALLDSKPSIVRDYIRAYWSQSERNYQAINDIIGAVFGALMEMDRRLGPRACRVASVLPLKFLQEFYKNNAAPYEDEKKASNGDVYRS